MLRIIAEAGTVLLQVRVRVDQAWQHVFAGSVDHRVGLHWRASPAGRGDGVQRNHVGDQVVFDHGILGSARGRAIAVHHDGVVDQQTARAFAASRSLRQQAPREREHEKQGSEHANDCATTR